MYLRQYSEVLLSYCRQGLQVLCIFLLVVPDVLEAAEGLLGISKLRASPSKLSSVCYCSLETTSTFSAQAALLFPWINFHWPAHPSNPSSLRRRGHLRAASVNAAVILLQR